MSLLDQTTITPDELRARLEDAGKTQTDLARALDIDSRAVRRWLAGDRELSGFAAFAARTVFSIWSEK